MPSPLLLLFILAQLVTTLAHTCDKPPICSCLSSASTTPLHSCIHLQGLLRHPADPAHIWLLESHNQTRLPVENLHLHDDQQSPHLLLYCAQHRGYYESVHWLDDLTSRYALYDDLLEYLKRVPLLRYSVYPQFHYSKKIDTLVQLDLIEGQQVFLFEGFYIMPPLAVNPFAGILNGNDLQNGYVLTADPGNPARVHFYNAKPFLDGVQGSARLLKINPENPSEARFTQTDELEEWIAIPNGSMGLPFGFQRLSSTVLVDLAGEKAYIFTTLNLAKYDSSTDPPFPIVTVPLRQFFRCLEACADPTSSSPAPSTTGVLFLLLVLGVLLLVLLLLAILWFYCGSAANRLKMTWRRSADVRHYRYITPREALKSSTSSSFVKLKRSKTPKSRGSSWQKIKTPTKSPMQSAKTTRSR